jgi:phage tail-like protein
MAKARYTTPGKRDPYRNFNFRIVMGGEEVAACRKISGLTGSVEVVKFRAGTNTSTVDEMLPGRVSYEAITVEAGITDDAAFKTWATQLLRHQRTAGSGVAEPDFRRDVTIVIYDIDNSPNRPVKKFELYNAWVSKFTALSELAADANEVLIETLEIQHEGFSEVPTGGA